MKQLERAGIRVVRTILGSHRASRIKTTYMATVRPAGDRLTYAFSRRGRRSDARLRQLRGAFAGDRCVVVGNGPSLQQTDLSLLRDEHVFLLNRGYLLRERIGTPNPFLVAVNRHVVEQFGSEIVDAAGEKFLSWSVRDLVPRRSNVSFVKVLPTPGFSEDARAGLWEGATVTYVALQLAYHMGFVEAILIGVDHAFSTSGAPHSIVRSDTDDTNHFDPSYFGPGTVWQLPDLETSERAYELARLAFERKGRRVIDATVGGRLHVFPKEDLRQLIESGRPC